MEHATTRKGLRRVRKLLTRIKPYDASALDGGRQQANSWRAELTDWKIGLHGRRWGGDEFLARAHALPGRIEVVDGRLLWSDAERLELLAMVLENVGMLAAVQLGCAELWRQAVESLEGLRPQDPPPNAK